MKVSELNKLIENIVSEEIKSTILKESEGGKYEVYHIKCEGEPIATFKTEDEAKEELPKYKKSHDGELIIEKSVYESHSDMIDKLDEMSEELEEKENQNMEKTETMEGNPFAYAALKAKEEGKETFEFGGETHNVEECWKQLEEEEAWEEEQYAMEDEEGCMECGDQSMEEKLVGNQSKLDVDKDGDIEADDLAKLRAGKVNEEQCCKECGKPLNEEGMCMECGVIPMNESKPKKVLRLRESELIELIKKMVNESSLPTATTKAQSQSKKDNDSNLSDVTKKIQDYLSIPGNKNPEFPQQNTEGESVKVNPTSEEAEKIDDEKGRGLENLNFDNEPSDRFKERLKMAIEGDSKMGNGHDAANVVKSELGKKIEKEVKRKKEDKENEPRYKKEVQPTKTVSESKDSTSNVLNEEIEKMKRLTQYNKKTQ